VELDRVSFWRSSTEPMKTWPTPATASASAGWEKESNVLAEVCKRTAYRMPVTASAPLRAKGRNPDHHRQKRPHGFSRNRTIECSSSAFSGDPCGFIDEASPAPNRLLVQPILGKQVKELLQHEGALICHKQAVQFRIELFRKVSSCLLDRFP